VRLGISDAKRLKALEYENAKLKKLLAKAAFSARQRILLGQVNVSEKSNEIVGILHACRNQRQDHLRSQHRSEGHLHDEQARHPSSRGSNQP
jgi:hypothetical protein